MAQAEKKTSLTKYLGHVTTWENSDREAYSGFAAELTTGKINTFTHATEAAALESLAQQLEAMAAEIRTLAKKAR